MKRCRLGSAPKMKRMKKYRLILILVALANGFASFGQQDIQFTQYFDNMLSVNPAYAGKNEMLSAVAIHREQWAGMDGRPRSTTLSLHSPLPYKSVGVGVSFVNDMVGPIRQTSIVADVSYSLRFKNSKGKLAFGLKGGLNFLNSRTDQLATNQAQDPNLLTNVRNQINPNVGAGIYYHLPQFFVGLSTPRFLEQSYGNSESAKERRHYFLSLGGVFNLTQNEQWKLRPTTMLKMTNGAPLAIDVTAATIYKNVLWLGLNYRVQDSFGAFVQYQLSPQFKAGIAYDQTVTELSAFNMGTYEVLLSYDFNYRDKGVISPRYF